MTIADLALLATLVMLVIVGIDAVRGTTALGKFRLSKQDDDPSRFWFAIVLYINMAFGLFWLAGQVTETEAQNAPIDEAPPVTVQVRTT